MGRKLIGAEFDISAKQTGTTICGVCLLGSSTVQPLGADGFSAGSLGGPAKWTHSFVSNDGVAATGLFLGSIAPAGTANAASQPAVFNYNAVLASDTGLTVQAVLGASNFNATGVADGITLLPGSQPTIQPNGTDANVNLALAAKGGGAVVTTSPLAAQQGLSVSGLMVAPSCAFSALPGAPPGTVAYWTNCREPGQAAGAGTGTMVFTNATGWRSMAGRRSGAVTRSVTDAANIMRSDYATLAL